MELQREHSPEPNYEQRYWNLPQKLLLLLQADQCEYELSKDPLMSDRGVRDLTTH